MNPKTSKKTARKLYIFTALSEIGETVLKLDGTAQSHTVMSGIRKNISKSDKIIANRADKIRWQSPKLDGPFSITLNCPKSDDSLSDAHSFPPQSSFQTLPRFTTSYAQASRTQTANWKWLLQRILQKVALEHYIEKVLHLKESAIMDPPMGGITFFLFFLTIAKMDTQNLESFGVVPNCVFFLHNRLLGILVPVNRFYFIVCLQCGIYYYFSLGTLHIVPFEIYSLVIKTCFGHRHGRVFS